MVKLSLCLTEHQENVQGSGDIVPCILILAIDGVSGLLHALIILPTLERGHQYPLDRRMGGPRASQDAMEKSKILATDGTQTLVPR
jgi:hypothetical protein